MSLRFVNDISLPSDDRPAAYGRPALDQSTARLYIPMMDDDALGVVDCIQNRYLHAIPNLPGVSAVLTSDQADVLFAIAPRSSEVVEIASGQDRVVAVLKVGGVPQELAYDPGRGHLLVAFANRQEDSGQSVVETVDVQKNSIIGDVRVPGPTRQVLYDRQSDMFYIVVADPAQIVVLDASRPTRVAHAFDVEANGLRSIAVGPQGTRLFCACDDSSLVTIDRRSGRLLSRSATGGRPDTIHYNPVRDHLYVAIADPGALEVFDTVAMRSLGRSETERGARHLAFDEARHKLYVLLPESHRVAVYEDSE